MDLSKLSDADLAAMASGDMTKMSDEGLAHITTEAPKQLPPEYSQEEPSIATALPSSASIKAGLVHGVSLGNLGQEQYARAKQDDPLSAGAASAIGNLASSGAIASLAPASLPVAVSAGLSSAAIGGLSKPEGEDSLESRAKNAGISGLLGTGAALAGQAASKSADWLAQKSVGLKDYLSGRGTTLLEEGVPSLTKGRALKAADASLERQGNNLENAVKTIKSTVDSHKAAQAIDSAGSMFSTRGGYIPESVTPEVNMIASRAEDVASRGKLPALEALDLKRIAQREGWSKAGNPLQNLGSDLARREAGAYGAELSSAYGAENVGKPNLVSEANKRLSAVLDATQTLNKDPTLAEVLKPFMTAGETVAAYPLNTVGKGLQSVSPLLRALPAEKEGK